MKPRPALNGLFIDFSATKYQIHPKSSPVRRTLLAVKLFEVSLVTDPSNGLARVMDIQQRAASDNNAVTALLRLRDAIKRA